MILQKKLGLAKTNVPEAKHHLKEVKGNLSEFPLDFLADTDMSILGDKRETLPILKPVNEILFFA